MKDIIIGFLMLFVIYKSLVLICDVSINIHNAKKAAMKNIYVNAVIQSLPVRIADNTNTRLNLSTTEEREMIEILFEDAIKEERLLTEIEIQMIKEIILNSPCVENRESALKSLNKYIINQNEELDSFDIKSACIFACMMVQFNLGMRSDNECHCEYDEYSIYYYDIV